jgi:soluble lytic murein transglycosylase-like protein
MPVFAGSPGQSVSQAPVRTVVRADAKTGRLVRTAVAPGAAASVPRLVSAQLTEMVDRIAGQQGVEAPLVHSVILAESNYNTGAVSPKGAQGIMQLIPSTARRFGVGNVFDAADNIRGGVRYLRFLLDYYHGDYTKSIAAYNAGEAAVDKYHGVPPYAETLGYVRTVAKHLTAARRNQSNASAGTTVPAASAAADTQPRIQAQTGADGLVYYRTP